MLTRRDFLESTAQTALGLVIPAAWTPQSGAAPANGARLQLMRNATSIIRYGGKVLLLDPLLGDAGILAPINNTPNPKRNPLVPLPIPASQVVTGADATLLTHTHFDHWDDAARELLPKARTIVVQPSDKARVEQAGFTDVRAIESTMTWEGITFARTGGQHGRGAVGQRMGTVSGYVLSRAGSPTIYIAGDTIWCPEVAGAIKAHKPDVIVVNAGEAQFLEGGPIIMGVDDVVNVCQAAPGATVVAVHMEAINHCLLTRDGLRAGLANAAVKSTVLIPRDGEDVRLS